MRNILELGATPVDANSPVPVYLQVEQDIRRHIREGQIGPDTRLPRETELAKLYGISRMTLRNALERLEEAGFIRRAHGVGTLVTVPPATVTCDLSLMKRLQAQILEQGFTPGIRIERREVARAGGKVAAELRLAAGAEAFFLQRLILVDARPMALIRSWVPAERFPGIATRELVEDSLWKTLVVEYGCRITRTSNTLELAEVTAAEAVALQMRDGERTIALAGLARDEADQPVEYSQALWAPTARIHFDAHA